MKSIVCALLLTGLACAAVDGVVNNQTVGKPQPGAAITLVELTGGMKTVGSVKSDNDGKFHFDATLSPATPHLIQAMHQGVTYNRVLPPGTDASALALEVFDSSAKAAEARVTQDMILLERSDKTLAVNETVIYTNTGKTTFQAPDGTLKIQVPPSVEEVKLRVTAPQGMPISRDAEKGKEAGIWLVRYPIKPGETRLDFSYTMPAGETTKFAGKILHGGGPVRFIAPQGMKLESAELTGLGPEPRTKAMVYELKGAQFAINVSGSGQLRAAAAETETSARGSASPNAAAEEDSTPGVEIARPRIYQRLPWILALAFGMLAVGFVALYSRGSSA